MSLWSFQRCEKSAALSPENNRLPSFNLCNSLLFSLTFIQLPRAFGKVSLASTLAVTANLGMS